MRRIVFTSLQQVGRLGGVVERRGVELETGAERRTVLGRRARRGVVGAGDRLAQDLGRHDQRVHPRAVEEA